MSCFVCFSSEHCWLERGKLRGREREGGGGGRENVDVFELVSHRVTSQFSVSYSLDYHVISHPVIMSGQSHWVSHHVSARKSLSVMILRGIVG